jgi:hypothetical protein
MIDQVDIYLLAEDRPKIGRRSTESSFSTLSTQPIFAHCRYNEERVSAKVNKAESQSQLLRIYSAVWTSLDLPPCLLPWLKHSKPLHAEATAEECTWIRNQEMKGQHPAALPHDDDLSMIPNYPINETSRTWDQRRKG